MVQKSRSGGGYNSRHNGAGLAAANMAEAEDRRDKAPPAKADKGEAAPLRKLGGRPANGGKSSSTGGPIHKKFDIGNNSTGRGHQAHIRGEHKKY